MSGMRADLVIRGGVVVTDGWSGPADVVVADGRVAALVEPGAVTGREAAADELDASGRVVVPGRRRPALPCRLHLGCVHQPRRLPAVHDSGGRRRDDDDRRLRHPAARSGSRRRRGDPARQSRPGDLRLRAARQCRDLGRHDRGAVAAARRRGPAHRQDVHDLPRRVDGRRGHVPPGDEDHGPARRHGLRALRGQPPHRGDAGRACRRGPDLGAAPPRDPDPARRGCLRRRGPRHRRVARDAGLFRAPVDPRGDRPRYLGAAPGGAGVDRDGRAPPHPR